MAEVDFDDFEDAVYAPAREDARAARMGRWLNYAGAASSVALVVLLAVWGTKLVLRDVNGVPVMRALDGAMRVAPSDPGGELATNQGLSVNAVASTGVASPVADQVVLAPAATALTEDDAAGLAQPVGGVAAAPAQAPVISADATALTGPAPETTATTPEMTADAAAPADAAPALDPVAAAVAEAMAEDPGAGMAKSLMPRARPGAAARASAPAAAAAPAAELDPATIAAGTRLAQLGAFDTPEEARARWSLLAGQYGEVMAGKSIVIQPAQSGGKTFYRLRAHGFESEDDARRFCAVLLAGNSDCIPVAQR